MDDEEENYPDPEGHQKKDYNHQLKTNNVFNYNCGKSWLHS